MSGKWEVKEERARGEGGGVVEGRDFGLGQ